MDCPNCGYVLSPFDKECARCKVFAEKGAVPPASKSLVREQMPQADQASSKPARLTNPEIGAALISRFGFELAKHWIRSALNQQEQQMMWSLLDRAMKRLETETKGWSEEQINHLDFFPCIRCLERVGEAQDACPACGVTYSEFDHLARTPPATDDPGPKNTQPAYTERDARLIHELAQQYAYAVRNVKSSMWAGAMMGPVGFMPGMTAEQRIMQIRQQVAAMGIDMNRFEDMALGPGRRYRSGSCVVVLACIGVSGAAAAFGLNHLLR